MMPALGRWRWGFTAPERQSMLRIYQVILGLIEKLQPVVRRIELKDRDLGRQLRRASCSVALSITEAAHKGMSQRFFAALGLIELRKRWRELQPKPDTAPKQLELALG
jgi:hypothetical protein